MSVAQLISLVNAQSPGAGQAPGQGAQGLAGALSEALPEGLPEGFARLLAARLGRGAEAGGDGASGVTLERQGSAGTGKALPDGERGEGEAVLAAVLAQLSARGELRLPGEPNGGGARRAGQRAQAALLARLEQWVGGDATPVPGEGVQPAGGSSGGARTDAAREAELRELLGQLLQRPEGGVGDEGEAHRRVARFGLDLAGQGQGSGANVPTVNPTVASTHHSPAPTQPPAATHAAPTPASGASPSAQAAGGQGLPQGFHAIDAAPQQAGWDQAVGERVVWMANRNMQAAEFRLHPPQLGTLDVRVSVSNDQAQVSFAVQHGAVRDAVEAALPRLREMFEQQGLSLVDVDVSDQQAGSYAGADADTDGAGGRDGAIVDGGDPNDDDAFSDNTTRVTAYGLIDAYA